MANPIVYFKVYDSSIKKTLSLYYIFMSSSTSASSNENAKGFEEALWDAANKLRGSIESSEYKHVVLSLIFLKFVADKFEERRAEFITEGKQDYWDMVEFYTMKNVFYLPEHARWNHLVQYAKQGDVAIRIDSALSEVEKNNPSLKGPLPHNYFSRLNLDPSKLAALFNAIKNKEENIFGRFYEYFLGKFAASEGKLGGMFVQSLKFVKSHHGNTKDISVYGQEHTGNANYAWILHMVSKLSDWRGATETTRQGSPKGEHGSARQYGVAGFCKNVTDKAVDKPEEIIKVFPCRTEVAA